jgi:hypothetical protein
MANILLYPTNWSDNDGSPPAYWNGSLYEFIAPGGQAIQAISCEELPSDGTVGFTLNVITPDTTEIPAYCRVQVNGDEVFLQTVAALGSFVFDSGPLSVNDEVIIDFVTVTTGPSGGTLPLYHGDYDITPTPDPSPPAPPSPPDCGELGRVTRSFVSGYTAARTEIRRIRRFSKRCVVANFNGAMPKGVTITRVRWETTSPWSIHMSNPRVESTGRTVAIDAAFNFQGLGAMLATATWSNGEITNAEFFFTVLDRPLYPSAHYNNANGPYHLEASA